MGLMLTPLLVGVVRNGFIVKPVVWGPGALQACRDSWHKPLSHAGAKLAWGKHSQQLCSRGFVGTEMFLMSMGFYAAKDSMIQALRPDIACFRKQIGEGGERLRIV